MMDRRQSRPSTSRRSQATARPQIPRRSADARPTEGPLTGRTSRTPARSALAPAADTAGPRRSSSWGCWEGRLRAQRPASKKDDRPFTNKSYLTESAEKLHALLKELSYPHHTTSQLLSRMSAREFQTVFEFLLKFFEPQFRLGSEGARMHDVVLEKLSLVHYPYPLQKSTLAGIGSQPHKALAIITWLADTVKYCVTTDALKVLKGTPTADRGNSAIILRYCLEYKDGGNHDKFLDRLVRDEFGVIEPTEELDKRLAEQEAELQRLTAQKQEEQQRQAAREVHLESEKAKVNNFETYFAQMEQHFEARRAQVKANEEAIKVVNSQKEEIRKQLLSQQALLREQRGRGEDRQSLQQTKQRLQISQSDVQSELEALRQKQLLMGLSWYSADEELRAANARLQQRLAPLRRVLPRSIRDHFDLRHVEDARALAQQRACNSAALARARGVLVQAVQDLQVSTRQEQRLSYEYSLKLEDDQRQVQLQEELMSTRKSCLTTQAADQRKQAQKLDEEFYELSKRVSDLELKTMSMSYEPAKAVADAKKCRPDADKSLAYAAANTKENAAVSDEER